MNNDASHPATPPDEQLVAYLDGELDAESSRHIEELLASDAQVRRRLQEMERTWDLLNDLDVAPAGNQLAQSTLEMVAVAARQDVQQRLTEAPRRRRRRRLAVGLSLLAVAAVGFLAVLLLTPNPNRQLLDDLPVLENLDEYRQITDIGFLKLLRDAGLFVGGTAETSTPPVELLPQRQQRIQGMSLSAKGQLSRLEERFLAFDPDQQQQLRRLHRAIQAAPDASQLRQVMHRYYGWVKTLPLYARMELAELEPAERVEAVKKRLKDGHGQPLGDKDIEVLWQWVNECAKQHEEQFRQNLPEPRRNALAKLTPSALHRMVVLDLGWQLQATGRNKPPPAMTNQDLASLRASLSPEMRRYLEPLPTTRQWQQVAAWMRHAVRQRHAFGYFEKDDDERLAEFFETELTAEERDRLLSLPGDEMQRRLQRLYLTRTRPPDGSSRRGNRFGGERPAKKGPDKGAQPPTSP